MAKRKFRIVLFIKGEFVAGMCEKCSATFTVRLAEDLQSATARAEAKFEKHKCKPLDANQTAARNRES